MYMRYPLASLSALVCLAGCETDDTAGSEPVTILSDDFSGAFPGEDWVITAGAPQLTTTSGNPSPALLVTEPAPGTLESTALFDVSGGLTLSFDAAFSSLNTGSPVRLGVRVEETGGIVQAIMNLDLEAGSASGADLVAEGCGNRPFNFDTAFHSFGLVLTEGVTPGTFDGTWLRDGADLCRYSGNLSSTTLLVLRFLDQSDPGAGASIVVDDVVLTKP